jgi:hypothetical protein
LGRFNIVTLLVPAGWHSTLGLSITAVLSDLGQGDHGRKGARIRGFVSRNEEERIRETLDEVLKTADALCWTERVESVQQQRDA